MSLTLAAGACTILSVTGAVSVDGQGWRQDLTITVAGAAGCDSLSIADDDPDAEITLVRGRVVSELRRNAPIADAQLVSGLLAPPGDEVLHRLHLGDLLPGEAARVTLRHHQTRATDVSWSLGPIGHLDVRVPKGLDAGGEGVIVEGRRVYAAADADTVRLTVAHPWAAEDAPIPYVEDAGLSAQDARARVDRDVVRVNPAYFGDTPVVGEAALALGAADHRGIARTVVALTRGHEDVVEVRREDGREVPVHVRHGGPPAVIRPSLTRALSDGAEITPGRIERRRVDVVLQGRTVGAAIQGLRVREELSWTPAKPADRGIIPLPGDLLGVDLAASSCGHLRITPYAVWWIGGPDRAPCSLVLERAPTSPWFVLTGVGPDPDDATLGARWDGQEAEVVLQRTGAVVAVARVGDRPVLDDLQRLSRLLDARFVEASYPTPGLPLQVRKRRANWETAALLMDALDTRAVVDDGIDVAPLQPRPLVRARRHRVVTSVEAAMILALYAEQVGFDADWAVAAPEGRSERPDDHRAGIVRLAKGDEVAWIDPGCRGCAPFEVRPELHGAPTLGPGSTPSARPAGSLTLDLTSAAPTLTATGAAALDVRQLLLSIPAPQRQAQAAAWFRPPHPDRVVVDVGRLAEPGADVTLTLVPDLQASSRWAWTGRGAAHWGGPRVLRRPTTRGDVPGACIDPHGLVYRVAVADGVTTETVAPSTARQAQGVEALTARCRASREDPP